MNESLGKIAKGTAAAVTGVLVFTFFEFITRIIIARYVTQSEYGAFNIGFALLNISIILSCLGLQNGVIRCIAFLRGKGEDDKVGSIVKSSLQLSVAGGILFFLVGLFLSDFLNKIFHLEHSMILKLFAITIPFLTIIEILSYIFIGFDRINVKVFFRDILLSLLRISGIILALILGFGFLGMIYAYLLPTVIVAILFIGYAAKKLSIHKSKNNALIREKLFRFSIPLLVTSISSLIMLRMDTLMLGYFKTSDVVGLYNAAYPIAQLIPLFLLSIIVVYIPISSQLYSKNHYEEMRRNYKVLTKWTFAATLPFFFVIFLFPEAVIDAVFGSSYVKAGDALRILAIGGLIQAFLGPNAATLVAIGNTKLNMIDDMIGAIVNLFLNILLIPPIGIIGAAIASTTSFSAATMLKSAQIFKNHRVHPFTGNYLKPILISVVFIYIIYLVVRPVHLIWMLILLFFLFIAVFILSLIVTRSLDEEDKMIFRQIEWIMGIDGSHAKRLLRRFM